VEISVPGLISGELVTVEAPAEHVRLKGGSIDGDRLLAAIVEQKLRAASAHGPTVSVLPAPPRFELEARQYLNHVFTDVGIAYWPVYDGFPVTRPDSGFRDRDRSRPRATRSSSPPPPGGRYAARGMMPRR
jgi:hypothetical protein